LVFGGAFLVDSRVCLLGAFRDTGRRVDAASASLQSASVNIVRSFAVASRSEHRRSSTPDQSPPISPMRAAIVRSVNARGPTAPPSSSAHVHGGRGGRLGAHRLGRGRSRDLDRTAVQVSVESAVAALDPRRWELVVAEERPPVAGTGVDAVIRARRLS
jgi:hypothetical protein